MSAYRNRHNERDSMSIYESYTECIEENLKVNPRCWSFKSDARYNYVLEHVSKEQGEQYLDLVIDEFPDFFSNHKDLILDICSKNDQLGKPKVEKFDKLVNGYPLRFSPTNMRYLYQSLLILEKMENFKLKEVDVIEIGGGYGGLCLFLNEISKAIGDVRIISYGICDLWQAKALQSLYLESHEIRLADIYWENSFLISNYAFSELTPTIRNNYQNHVINPYCSHGFLAWNGCDFYEFVKNKAISREKERPETHPRNEYVTFEPKK